MSNYLAWFQRHMGRLPHTPEELHTGRRMFECLTQEEQDVHFILPPSQIPSQHIGPGNSLNMNMAIAPDSSCQMSLYKATNAPKEPLRLLMMRLRRDDIPESKFQYLNVAVCPNKTFVSFYKGDEMTTLEDDTAMFPSDNLVAAIQLLLG